MSRLALAAALLAAALPCGAEVLDAIVARVDRKAISWSEVVQEKELLGLTGEEVRSLEPAGVVDLLVRRRLLVEEARRMRLEVSSSEQAAAVKALAGAAGGAEAFWRRVGKLGLSEADVARRAEEVLLVERFAGLRLEMTYVPESEVREYYRERTETFRDRPLAEVRDEIRSLLAKRKQQQELDKWMERQVADGRVRLEELPVPAAPGPGGG